MTSVAGAFLIDSSSPCELQLEQDVFTCTLLSSSSGGGGAAGQHQKKTLRIKYTDVIAVKRVLRKKNCDSAADSERQPQLSPPPTGATYCSKVKIYYAKRKLHKLTGRLIKLKRIVIEQTQQQQVLQARFDSKLPPTQAESLNSCKQEEKSSLPKEAPCELQSYLNEFYERLSQHVELTRRKRPKRLLVFINPFGGKGNALSIYKSQVKRLFDLVGLESEVVVTKYANHARDTVEDPQFDVEQFDGIICIGGDGMFSELMNGLLFRCNRDKILATDLGRLNKRLACSKAPGKTQLQEAPAGESNETLAQKTSDANENEATSRRFANKRQGETGAKLSSGDCNSFNQKLDEMRLALGGIGQQLTTPTIPIGMIGAGSTDANVFGFIGTNDVISATLNILLGKQIQVDVCSVHSISDDRLLRFVSTFIAYGYFGDVVRESERLRWLGPTRYDVTGFQRLLKNRAYNGLVRIVRSQADGTPHDMTRCHSSCKLCNLTNSTDEHEEQLEVVERRGAFMGVNAAVIACRCPKTKQGFSPGNHLANGCADLVLVRPCSRVQYLNYLFRISLSKSSPFELNFVEAFRCRQFEFFAQDNGDNCDSGEPSRGESGFDSLSSADRQTVCSGSNSNSLDSKQSYSNESGTLESGSGSTGSDSGSSSFAFSSWNADGEILNEQSIRVKVNRRLLRVFGTGEPTPSK